MQNGATHLDWHAALAALAWQIDLGVTDAIGDLPVDRFSLAEREAEAPKPLSPAVSPHARPAAPKGAPVPAASDPAASLARAIAAAEEAARGAPSLDSLRAALAAYPHCDLRRGARNLVFADGMPGARVLVLGEAPGRDEDMEGRPFVGAAGQLLDRMFAAIGLARDGATAETALYITNVLPWRPPGNRDPEPDEIAMMRPFLHRHIALAAPEVVVVMGNIALMALTGRTGIMNARGTWTEAAGRPVLAMTHPAYLLLNPVAKRAAWADLLALQSRLQGGA